MVEKTVNSNILTVVTLRCSDENGRILVHFEGNIVRLDRFVLIIRNSCLSVMLLVCIFVAILLHVFDNSCILVNKAIGF